MIYVLWHKVPDTDAITSAIVYAHYLNQTWYKAIPLALGEANKETLFVLEQAWVTVPDINPELVEGSTIALVDHNESAQSISNIKNYTIHSVIDHHKIGDLETWYPLILRFEPVASTNTVLYKMYKESHITLDKSIATLMLGGILSDTLHFRSPTTTEFEKSIVPELAHIAEIDDITSFAMSMFAAKSDLGDISAYTLIKHIDAKDFTFAGRKALIACIETTNPDYCLSRKTEILDTIRTIKSEEWYDFILFCVIDILHEKNTTLVASDAEAKIIKDVFGADTVDGQADLWDRISRKKTIVPVLEEKLI